MFGIRIDVYHHVGDVSLIPALARIERKLDTMTQQSEDLKRELAETEGKVDLIIAAFNEVPALKAKIAELQAQVDAGEVDKQTMADVTAGMDNLQKKIDDVLSPPAPEPEPPTE